MRAGFTLLLVSAVSISLKAFTPVPAVHKTSVVSLHMGYVPDGFTPEQWKKKQEKERQEKKGKNFGAFGPQSFKSRSLQAFHKDLEKGKADHLMPVMFAKDRVKKGELKAEDVPYMQRGGSWDNTDVKGAKKRKWSKADQKYADETAGSSKGGGNKSPKSKKLFGMW